MLRSFSLIYESCFPSARTAWSTISSFIFISLRAFWIAQNYLQFCWYGYLELWFLRQSIEWDWEIWTLPSPIYSQLICKVRIDLDFNLWICMPLRNWGKKLCWLGQIIMGYLSLSLYSSKQSGHSKLRFSLIMLAELLNGFMFEAVSESCDID